MKSQRKPRYAALALILIIALIVPVLAACDDDDDDETTMPSTTEQPTTEPTQNAEPVKIGVSMPFTGEIAVAGAMANAVINVVEKQVEERGGIQVGDVRRPLEVITFDDEGVISGTLAAWAKLVKDEGIAIMGFGGASGAQLEAMAEQSTEYKVPFINYAGAPTSMAGYPYGARVGYSELGSADPMIKLIDELQPKTIALLGDEEKADHTFFDHLKDTALTPRGIEVVYEQYIVLGTADLSPYLTRIRREAPDMLIHFAATYPTAEAAYKQIMDQGGWGDITYLAARTTANNYLNLPGAEGSYQFMVWTPKLDNQGTKELMDAWGKYGKGKINPSHVYFYNGLWTAIHAIEMAGSDAPEDINNVLHSGNFSWEAPIGTVTIDTDGENHYTGLVIKVGKDGEYTIAYQ